MKTEELIESLVADNRVRHDPMARRLGAYLTLGFVPSALGLTAVLGIRPEAIDALNSWQFVVKLAIVALSITLAWFDCVRLANPVNTGLISRSSWLLPVALGVAVAAELATMADGAWQQRLIGSNAVVCLGAIPTLSITLLIAGLIAMRRGAPSDCSAAGAAIGRLSAAIAAALYALHCVDDSPLFVAVWYTLATLPSMALGSLAGSRLLRW